MKKTYFLWRKRSIQYLALTICFLLSAVYLVLVPMIKNGWSDVFIILICIALIPLSVCIILITKGVFSTVTFSQEGIVTKVFLKTHEIIKWKSVTRAETVKMHCMRDIKIAIDGFDEIKQSETTIYLDKRDEIIKVIKSNLLVK